MAKKLRKVKVSKREKELREAEAAGLRGAYGIVQDAVKDERSAVKFAALAHAVMSKRELKAMYAKLRALPGYEEP